MSSMPGNKKVTKPQDKPSQTGANNNTNAKGNEPPSQHSAEDLENAKIPLSGHWICLPLEQDERVNIEWMSDKTTHSAPYYACRCWWGHLTPKKSEKIGDADVPEFEALGETVLFVAAEYIEEKYAGAEAVFPGMAKLHLRDRVNSLATTTNAKSSKQESSSTWARLPLDGKFHYGQDRAKKPRFRFLVYHPPLAKSAKPRNMYQHRFIECPSKAFALAVASMALESSSDYLSAAGSIATPLIKLVSAVAGHYLHQYLDPTPLTDSKATTLSEAMKAGAEMKQKLTGAANIAAIMVLEAAREKENDAAAHADGKEWEESFSLQLAAAAMEAKAVHKIQEAVANSNINLPVTSGVHVVNGAQDRVDAVAHLKQFDKDVKALVGQIRASENDTDLPVEVEVGAHPVPSFFTNSNVLEELMKPDPREKSNDTSHSALGQLNQPRSGGRGIAGSQGFHLGGGMHS